MQQELGFSKAHPPLWLFFLDLTSTVLNLTHSPVCFVVTRDLSLVHCLWSFVLTGYKAQTFTLCVGTITAKPAHTPVGESSVQCVPVVPVGQVGQKSTNHFELCHA